MLSHAYCSELFEETRDIQTNTRESKIEKGKVLASILIADALYAISFELRHNREDATKT